MTITLLTENKFHAAEIVKEAIQKQINIEVRFGAEYGLRVALILTCSDPMQGERIIRYAEDTTMWYSTCNLTVRRA